MQKKSLKLIGLIALNALLIACKSTAEVSYVPQKVTGLKTPESALQAKDGRIFVSEIGEFGKDGDGQITVIDTTGKASAFARGLNDPKGLAMIGQNLYVADKTQVMKISPDGTVSVFAAASAFPSTPLFLNDLEADTQGNLYVSDSGDIFKTGKGGAIHKISLDGKVTPLITDKDTRIKAPNGLLMGASNDELIEVDFASGILHRFNQKAGSLSQIAEGFGGGDGVVHAANGGWYVSDWKNGKVFSVSAKGEVKLIKEGYQSAADIAITQDGKFLMVPDMKAGDLDFIPLQ